MRRSCSAPALVGAAFASVCLTFVWPQVTTSRADFLEIEFAPGTPPFWGVPAYHYNFGPPIGGRRVVVPQIYRGPRPPVVIEKVPYRPPSEGPGRRTICVRTCDGDYFPLSALRKASEVDAQQARCSKLCPGAASRLFVMGEKSARLDEARPATGGGAYATLLASLGKSEGDGAACSCQAGVRDPLAPGSELLVDRTLRPGDAVVTPTGVRVFQAGGRFPYRASNFLPLEAARGLAFETRRALFMINRSLRTRHRGAPMNGGWKSAAE